MPLARHALVDVEAGAWKIACAALDPCRELTREQRATVENWIVDRRPAIGRRPTTGNPSSDLAIGIPLPPSLGKLRIALSVPATSARPRPAVPLADARAEAPAAWRPMLDSLAGLGRSVGIVPLVYGALLWQFLTGMVYVRSESDLDLLWPLEDRALLRPLLDELTRIDAAGPVRLDGEVLTPAGGVNWRELAAVWPHDRLVLVKNTRAAGLLPATALFQAADARC